MHQAPSLGRDGSSAGILGQPAGQTGNKIVDITNGGDAPGRQNSRSSNHFLQKTSASEAKDKPSRSGSEGNFKRKVPSQMSDNPFARKKQNPVW
jgi:hypothetical protein